MDVPVGVTALAKTVWGDRCELRCKRGRRSVTVTDAGVPTACTRRSNLR